MKRESITKQTKYLSEDERMEAAEIAIDNAKYIPIMHIFSAVGSAGDDKDGTNDAFFAVPSGKNLVITSIKVISLGTPEGIDDGNTSVIAIKYGTTTVSTKTFNTGTAFPAAKAVDTMTISSGIIPENSVLFATLTNGATAKTPAMKLQVLGYLK